MAIKVYILKKSIMKSSMDEYLEMKAELKAKLRFCSMGIIIIQSLN